MVMDATGNYVVVWQDVLNVYARIYDTSGAALNGALRANTDTMGLKQNLLSRWTATAIP